MKRGRGREGQMERVRVRKRGKYRGEESGIERERKGEVQVKEV